jgi:hypothetical protein
LESILQVVRSLSPSFVFCSKRLQKYKGYQRLGGVDFRSANPSFSAIQSSSKREEIKGKERDK